MTIDTTLVGSVITAAATIFAAYMTVKHTQKNKKKHTEPPAAQNESEQAKLELLQGVVHSSQRRNVTTDWITGRTGWPEEEILTIARAFPNAFYIGRTEQSKRQFVRLRR